MKTKHTARPMFAIALLAMSLPLLANAGDERSTDGMNRVEMRGIDQAWVAPRADLKRYNKVLIDTPEVNFRDSWVRNFNRSSLQPGRKLKAKDLQEIATELSEVFNEEYAQAFRQAGYQVVTESGPDVLQLSPEIAQLYLNNPPYVSQARTDTYVIREGEATLILEARDAQSGQLLALTKDNRETRDVNQIRLTNRVFMLSDFRELFQAWGEVSASDLTKLQLQPAIAAN